MGSKAPTPAPGESVVYNNIVTGSKPEPSPPPPPKVGSYQNIGGGYIPAAEPVPLSQLDPPSTPEEVEATEVGSIRAVAKEVEKFFARLNRILDKCG